MAKYAHGIILHFKIDIMPNHVKNKLAFTGIASEIEKLVAEFSTFHPSTQRKSYDGRLIYKNNNNSYGWLDSDGFFYRRDMAPVMGVLDGYEPSMEEEWTRFPDFEKIIHPPNDPAYRDEPDQAAASHSPNWWYNWNVKNWGVKWNSYSCFKESSNIFTFETAWSGVPELIEIISKKFPEVNIEYKYSDEDTGYNCGHMKFRNGVQVKWLIENGSRQAYELAFELRPCRRDDYVFDGTSYTYKEEEDEE